MSRILFIGGCLPGGVYSGGGGVCSQGGVCSGVPGGNPPPMDTPAGGTHPIGMHSNVVHCLAL